MIAMIIASRSCASSVPRVPIWPSSQRPAPARYGAACAKSSSEDSFASAFHCRAIFRPTSGTFPTQSGGCGTRNVRSAFDHAMMSSDRSAMAMTAVANGAAMTRTIRTVITATARLRLPQSRRSSRRSVGQVATTIVVAQMPASRNGLSTQKLRSARPPMVITPRTIRVRSQLRSGVVGASMAVRPLSSEHHVQQTLQQLAQRHHGEDERGDRQQRDHRQLDERFLGDGHWTHALNSLEAIAQIRQGLDVGASHERLTGRAAAAEPLVVELEHIALGQGAILAQTD